MTSIWQLHSLAWHYQAITAWSCKHLHFIKASNGPLNNDGSLFTTTDIIPPLCMVSLFTCASFRVLTPNVIYTFTLQHQWVPCNEFWTYSTSIFQIYSSDQHCFGIVHPYSRSHPTLDRPLNANSVKLLLNLSMLFYCEGSQTISSPSLQCWFSQTLIAK